jgi:hypothetical protein
MAGIAAPPAIVSPAPAASDAQAAAIAMRSPVATPPTEPWSRFVMGWQAFDAALRDWRHTWVSAEGRREMTPASLRLPGERRPPLGSLRAVQFGFIQGATYWKHALMPTMALDQEVVGYAVMMNKRPNDDGDITMDIVPLPDYAPVLIYEGRYRPRVPLAGAVSRTLNTPEGMAMELQCGGIHCEFKANSLTAVQPFLLAVREQMLAGRMPVVAVRGRWTFDPFHGGWVEIHPARAGRILSETGEGFPRPLPLPAGAQGGPDDEP